MISLISTSVKRSMSIRPPPICGTSNADCSLFNSFVTNPVVCTSNDNAKNASRASTLIRSMNTLVSVTTRTGCLDEPRSVVTLDYGLARRGVTREDTGSLRPRNNEVWADQRHAPAGLARRDNDSDPRFVVAPIISLRCTSCGSHPSSYSSGRPLDSAKGCPAPNPKERVARNAPCARASCNHPAHPCRNPPCCS